jgi:hypothetical protein
MSISAEGRSATMIIFKIDLKRADESSDLSRHLSLSHPKIKPTTEPFTGNSFNLSFVIL